MKRIPGLPTRQAILDFIARSDTPAGKREIARAFGLHGADKIALKSLLKDMADEGLIDSAPGRAFHKMGGLAKITVLRVADVDDGGNVWAVPERWEAEGVPVPRLRVREGRGRGAALGVGDRILARTEEAGRGWIAHPMKKLEKGEERMLGVLRREGEKLVLQGIEKKDRRELLVSDAGGAEPGDLVLAEKAGRPPRITARVVQVLGDPHAPRSFSLIAIHKLGIPTEFDPETLEEANRVAKLPILPGTGRGTSEAGGGGSPHDAALAESPLHHAASRRASGRSCSQHDLGLPGAIQPSTPPPRAGEDREDLRHLPIIAIDPADARDHDDAVWAEPREDGGWNAIVAIADVSFYVRPGSALDRDARRRGNSVYFPDRVVPMLPEELSADICSLKEGEDRAALVCHLVVGKGGQLKDWRFARAIIRVAANLAYEDAQATVDAGKGQQLDALKPLWDCWRALWKAREARGPLDLYLPERRVMLDEKGRILSVAPRERLDAHKLIEEYMIAANVAAAKALEAKKAPVMYRVHEPPSREKLVALKDYLATFEVEFALGQVIRPATFNRVLERVGDADFKPQIMEQVLRTQTQAYYAPVNHGHFGLALGSYAHFTSPIRRYADLVVHRALVATFGLGEGGLLPADADMERIGQSISMLERRAMEAERDTIDRYVAAFLSERVGEIVEARITGVQPFGFFASVEGVGGDGLVPARDLGQEYFRYDEASQRLIGDDSGETYASGQKLQLRLAEANPVSGALRFELPEGAGGAVPSRKDRGRPLKRRGRPGNIRHQGRKR